MNVQVSQRNGVMKFIGSALVVLIAAKANLAPLAFSLHQPNQS